MSAATICPECGGDLAAKAAGGLCARCLLGAAVDGSTTGAFEAEEFKRMLVELAVVHPAAIDRIIGKRSLELPALVGALVSAQVLTAYQASAIKQGKARGLVVGRYLILEKLGAGGMGVVFKARHNLTNRIVALKILRPSFAGRHELVTRFRREMQAAARLNHPNMVGVLDAGEDRGVYFFAMEYVEGRDLDGVVRDRGALPVEPAIDCVIQAARGLQAAHSRGIVHRDIKPGNLMLEGSGTVRVLDLGLARLVLETSVSGQTTDHRLTRSGAFVGTVDFMAPEQADDSHNVDHRADIYSLGCSLYFLLTGRTPFQGATMLARVMAHQESPPPSLRAARPDVSESLNAAYLAMLAKRPDARPHSMANVIALLNSSRPSARSAGTSISLESFTTTIFETPALSADSRGPRVFIARDVSGGFRFEPELDMADRHANGRTVAPGRGINRAGIAVLGVLGALVPFFAFYVQSKPRNPEAQPPAALVAENSNASTDAPVESATTFDVTPIFTRHEGPVDTVAVSRDGELALSAGRDHTARLWDVRSGNQRLDPLRHPSEVLDVAISPDSRAALTATHGRPNTNGIVRLWSLENGATIFPHLSSHAGAVQVVAFVANTQGLSGGHDGHAALWDLETGELIGSLGANNGYVRSHALAVFPDGDHAITGGEDGLVHVWNLATRDQDRQWKAHDGPVSGISISADGTRVVTCGHDYNVTLWDFTGASLRSFKMPDSDRARSVAILPDGSVLAAGATVGNIMQWNADTGAVLRQAQPPLTPHLDLAVLPPDGRRFLTADLDGVVRIWTLRGP
jgi:eukaryotic-like serine/threonine-protein kinase